MSRRPLGLDERIVEIPVDFDQMPDRLVGLCLAKA
jgi:hypothetical protein